MLNNMRELMGLNDEQYAEKLNDINARYEKMSAAIGGGFSPVPKKVEDFSHDIEKLERENQILREEIEKMKSIQKSKHQEQSHKNPPNPPSQTALAGRPPVPPTPSQVGARAGYPPVPPTTGQRAVHHDGHTVDF